MEAANVIVTGGAGFIGSHLVDALLARGDKVRVIDDLSEGGLEHLTTHPHLSVSCESILDGIGIWCKGVDVIYHLAALPRPQYSVQWPVKTHRVNVDGTLEVLMAAKANKVRRVVFASSASVYGEAENVEIETPRPMTPYSLHKLIGEQYCKLFADLYGLETVALRFFNVYGERQNPDGEYASVIPKFIKILAGGGTPTIYGTGLQSRDFVHVSDVVRALVLAGEKECSGQVINVGAGETVSIVELYGMVCHALNTFVEPTYGPAQVEPQTTCADSWKAKRMLGWMPRIELKEGIRQLAEKARQDVRHAV